MPRQFISNLFGLVGGIVGGTLGFYTFGWLYGQGYYGLIIPGAFLGLGCNLLAQHRSTIRGVCCGLAAVALALGTEWNFRPFAADQSLRYFAGHITDLSSTTLLMVTIGAFVAFWLGGDATFYGLSVRHPSLRMGREPEAHERE